MAIWARIKRLSIKQFLLLIKTFITKPLYIIPTHKATLQSLQICDKKFGKRHHKHGPENAFRHALWNIMIAKNCFKPERDPLKIVQWAETITTLHEKMAPNNPIETAMDMHNNDIGRHLFMSEKLYEKSIEEINQILLEKMKNSVKVTSIQELETVKSEMAHIE